MTPPGEPLFSPALFLGGLDRATVDEPTAARRRVGTGNLVPRVLFPPLIDVEAADETHAMDANHDVVPVSRRTGRGRVGLFRYNIDEPWPSVRSSDVGACDVVCDHCHALRWKGETKGMCCRNGAVQLPPLLEPPSPLWLLLNDTTSEAKKFRTNIRKYNAALMMASSTAKVQHNFGGGSGAFRINGTYTIA